jgi:hypothetical protein
MPPPNPTRRRNAEIVGLRALAFIAADDHALSAFIAESGLTPAHLQSAAVRPEVLAGALDFLLGEERRFLAFCEEIGLAPELVLRARALLPGATPEES